MAEPSDNPMTAPFAGIKIIDLTRFFAGPFGTYQFALQGAEVIKIEPLEGDDIRHGGLESEWKAKKLTPAFMSMNANKKSIALDLKNPEAVDIIHQLVKGADVVWENFRPGVATRLKIGYEDLKKINPKLIYCAVSGFGQTGPLAKEPAFDGVIQAESGLMSITGTKDSGPTRVGFAAADQVAGITAAFAVSAALFEREKSGAGKFVDVSMMDSMLSLLTQQVAEYTVTGQTSELNGNMAASKLPTGNRFKCQDGYVVIAAVTGKQIASLMSALSLGSILEDERYNSREKLIINSAAVHQIIEAETIKWKKHDLESELLSHDVPCGKVNSIGEIIREPQIAHRRSISTVSVEGQQVRLMGAGFQIDGEPAAVNAPPPRLGQDTLEILRSLRLPEDHIRRLVESKVVHCA